MIVLEPGGQRPVPHHMPHGEIHQYDKKTDGCDQAPLQNRSLMIRRASSAAAEEEDVSFAAPFNGSAIARLFHSGDDLLGRSGSLHAHGVGQKADGTGSNSRNMGNGFFHRALQAAQLIPVTVYCSIKIPLISSVSAVWQQARRWFHLCLRGCPAPRRCGYGLPAVLY